MPRRCDAEFAPIRAPSMPTAPLKELASDEPFNDAACSGFAFQAVASSDFFKRRRQMFEARFRLHEAQNLALAVR